ADRANGEHAGQPCQNCHRQHGPDKNGPAKPPACTTCHVRKDLPGMHQVSGHVTCTSCHVPHAGRPKGDPPTCLECHTDKKDHNAGTKSCIGCHVFRTGDK